MGIDEEGMVAQGFYRSAQKVLSSFLSTRRYLSGIYVHNIYVIGQTSIVYNLPKHHSFNKEDLLWGGKKKNKKPPHL